MNVHVPLVILRGQIHRTRYHIVLIIVHTINLIFQIEPYVTMYNNSVETSPADTPLKTSHYYGYMVDILDRLGDVVRFRYSIQPAVDDQFGFARMDGSGQWTGMVGELLEKVIQYVKLYEH